MSVFHRLLGNRRRMMMAAAVLGLIVGGLAAWASAAVAGFHRLATEEFSPGEAREVLETDLEPGEPEQVVTEPTSDYVDPAIVNTLRAYEELQASPAHSPRLPDEMFTSILLIGADASGYLADVVILVLVPEDGASPMMVSLPRDLWLPNPCTERYGRLNANLGGCKGTASGPELLSLAVEDFTGVKVDHFARVNFDGFQSIIDRMGGVTVCVDAPTRDVDAGLQLEAGCIVADGATALSWVRSRKAEQLVGETWTPIGSSDFTRQRHQQDVLFQLARKLRSYKSVASLGKALSNLSSAVRLDSAWSIIDVATLGFRYRNLTEDDIIRLSVPTDDFITSAGAYVLLPTQKFNEVLAEAYPPAAR